MTTKLLANQLNGLMKDPVEGFTVELVNESSLYEWKNLIIIKYNNVFYFNHRWQSINHPKYPIHRWTVDQHIFQSLSSTSSLYLLLSGVYYMRILSFYFYF
ncbi:hypothetical protein PPL_05672 [Heterostelium album PN500]|uniref:Uncharacterized protein n=1 Tax=Heterostelium pallidum (strain ATCC 26659 / Pp 5 / PN500) TaxID=670386 RepID=D3BAU1_HETP5|nr:hypothetical protein PPL_05672 [Heterostelium album PN500]EFA81678.1 hypothetical protein PPL_05672 [Heterostelium album PN500]|eukprot:XP_020433795.1 hypothetical protein PPL_05672 [Heterostelium album PN500]